MAVVRAKNDKRVTEKMKTDAGLLYYAREKRLAAEREEKAIAARLRQAMGDVCVDRVECMVRGKDDAPLLIEAVEETKPTNIVDILRLQKEVSSLVFAKCISATQTAVEKHAGKTVLAKVLTDGDDQTKFSVRPKK